MSGGYFNDSQRHLKEIIDFLESACEKCAPGGALADDFSEKTKLTLTNGLHALNLALVYTERIDYLLSGDTGEERFHAKVRQALAGDPCRAALQEAYELLSRVYLVPECTPLMQRIATILEK